MICKKQKTMRKISNVPLIYSNKKALPGLTIVKTTGTKGENLKCAMTITAGTNRAETPIHQPAKVCKATEKEGRTDVTTGNDTVTIAMIPKEPIISHSSKEIAVGC